jgi:hypothetical protein
MLIGDEPSDGNYARYVELLSTGKGGEPGRVYTWRQRAARPMQWSSPAGMPPLPDALAVPAPPGIALPSSSRPNAGLPDGFAPPSAEQIRQRARNQAQAPSNARPELSTDHAGAQRPAAKATQETTLAAQAGGRLLAWIFRLVGLGVGLTALLKLLHTVTRPGFTADELPPVIFLFVCAFMLIRAARAARNAANRPLAKLPPLTTLVKTNPQRRER